MIPRFLWELLTVFTVASLAYRWGHADGSHATRTHARRKLAEFAGMAHGHEARR